VRILFRPGERLTFGLEEAIHYDRISLRRRSTCAPRGEPAFDVTAGVDGRERAVWQNHFAAIGNLPRVDGTVAFAQANTRRGLVFLCPLIGPRAAAGPVNSDAREHRTFGSDSGHAEQGHHTRDDEDSLHTSGGSSASA
jgi:hypothetical protein